VVLSGSLHEFILADIFQLLSQQNATGRLSVTSDRRSGYVILSHGSIIAAVEGRECIEEKIIASLRTVKKVSEKKLASIANELGTNPQKLSTHICNNGLLSKEELGALALATIEDISCSLFAWDKGEYKFESLEDVEKYLVAGVSITTDNVIMEAMRRIDENKRLQIRINDNTIFVLTSNAPLQKGPVEMDIAAIVNQPQQYLLAFIDGTSTIGDICKNSLVSRYRIYETIGELSINEAIVPLAPKLSNSIQAAIKKQKPSVLNSFLKSSIAVGICILIIISILLLRSILFLKNKPVQEQGKGSTEYIESLQKETIGELYYNALRGEKPKSKNDLIKARILKLRDIAPLLKNKHGRRQ